MENTLTDKEAIENATYRSAFKVKSRR